MSDFDAFDAFEARARDLLGTAGEIPELMSSLAVALHGHHHDVAEAAADGRVVRHWTGVADETRAAVLMALAWASREADFTAQDSAAARYAEALHACARDFAGDVRAFAGPGFPRPPFPGRAGALATSAAGDRDRMAGLTAAFVLTALTRQILSAPPEFPGP